VILAGTAQLSRTLRYPLTQEASTGGHIKVGDKFYVKKDPKKEGVRQEEELPDRIYKCLAAG
jgi:hypothetical protein